MAVLIDKLLEACVKQGASDIHITVGQPPVFRLHGRLRKLETKVLEPEDTVALMKSISPDRCQRELQEAGSSDFGFAFGDKARFRVSIFKQRGNISMVLRQIPTTMLTPEQLGLPDVLKKLVMRPRGLFLVTGPTGSGKSTTLASLVNFLNETVDHHIITIEDPVLNTTKTITRHFKDENEAQVARQVRYQLAKKDLEPVLPWVNLT